MCVERIGYGCGQKDYEAANCIRALLGNAVAGDELTGALHVGVLTGGDSGHSGSRAVPSGVRGTADHAVLAAGHADGAFLRGSSVDGTSATGASFGGSADEKTAACGCDDVLELRCNVDDMTPEALGFALEELLAAGALDAFTIPIGMKKSRPGTLLTCLCHADQREEMVRLLFLHTTTLGVRETLCHRYTLDRSTETVQTEYGPVRVKVASGWGVQREKPEYEDLARIARQQGLSLYQVRKTVSTRG